MPDYSGYLHMDEEHTCRDLGEDELVERVARAIYGIEERWPRVDEEVRKTYRADARRAIAALSQVR